MDNAYIRMKDIVCSKILPPIFKPGSAGSLAKLQPHLGQAIMVTRLESGQFDNYIQNIEHIYLAFMNHFPDRKLNKWKPTRYQGIMALDTHAHYFTQKHFVPSSKSIPFHSTVDPDGVLENIRGEDMVHAADNDVDYFVQLHDTENKPM
ncbi:hypothetical protein BDN70DRAFT_818551 [Pholiota conissans]|uniref:Uncharacterized protein n=1 Tax=Pholiota conissans TaxID=109636 RepID=A0A9P5YMI6_9AGAR|nr:hypothetical protein BDN70DRAFT_818551 [Pholiota conissans]